MHDSASKPEPDERSPQRRDRDEAIAAEPMMQPLELSDDGCGRPLEAHLGSVRPLALPGVVENGLVRPLDPAVKLAERSRVIIVTSEQRRTDE